MQQTLNPTEISELIRKRVEQFEVVNEARNEGTIVSVSDGICRIHGLADAMQGEMIEFPGDTYGLALNLERDSVGVVIIGDYEHLVEGDTARCTGKILQVPVGEGMLGRVVDALGEPIDGAGPIEAARSEPISPISASRISSSTWGSTSPLSTSWAMAMRRRRSPARKRSIRSAMSASCRGATRARTRSPSDSASAARTALTSSVVRP